MADVQANPADRAVRNYLFAGLAACLLLVGGVGGLGAVLEISGAVIGSGTVVVDSNVKKVQHANGGVVASINVREGDHVRAGDVLLSLDETLTRANLAIVLKSLDELNVRVARLEAERDGLTDIDLSVVPAETTERAGFGRLAAGERSLLELRRQAREGQKAQLRQRVLQLAEEIGGLTEQRFAKEREIELIETELDSVRQLWEQKLVSLDRMTALERAAVRLEGEHGQLTAAIAQTKGRSAETELQILQIDQQMRSEVATELRDARTRIAELEERQIAAEDTLKHIDIRSPQDGIVHALAVHTIGGVVTPAESLMLIVPIADDLTIETRIAPPDIDQVSVGQGANLRLSAFNQQTTPELTGVVTRISPDLVVDPQTGVGFYTARINLPKEEVAKLGDLTLTPGMPVEVFLPTGDRTVLSYLVKPLADQMKRAFREG
jgi:HlyD family secretion protein